MKQAPFGTASQSSAARVRGLVEMLRTCEVHSSKPSSNETLCQRAGRLTDENMWQFWFVVNVGYFWLTFWQCAVIIAAKFGQFGAIWSNFGQFSAISCNPISCNLGQFEAISTNFSNFFGLRHAIFNFFQIFMTQFEAIWGNFLQFRVIWGNFGQFHAIWGNFEGLQFR